MHGISRRTGTIRGLHKTAGKFFPGILNFLHARYVLKDVAKKLHQLDTEVERCRDVPLRAGVDTNWK